MKIVLTITTIAGGGAERAVCEWANWISQAGHETSILIAGHVKNEYRVSNRVKVYALSDDYSDYQKLSYMGKLKSRRDFFKKHKPDYIVSFLPHVQIMTYLSTVGLHLKRVETVRNSPWNEEVNGNKIMRILWKHCFKTSYMNVMQTEDQTPYFSKAIQKKTIIVRNPISDLFVNTSRDKYSDEVTTFVAAGRINKQKNYGLMIESFVSAAKKFEEVHHREIHLQIYGAEDGGSMKQYEDQIQNLKAEKYISFMGRSNNLPEVYLSSDAYLMSSDFEGMPNALAEAMATGLVCISTDCKTGPRDMIQNGENGFLVPVRDAQAMADAVYRVAELSSKERSMLGTNARNSILALCNTGENKTRLLSIFDRK